MNILLIIVIVIAVILAITGGLVQSLQFLLWVGLVLLAIAVIAWLIRAISGGRRSDDTTRLTHRGEARPSADLTSSVCGASYFSNASRTLSPALPAASFTFSPACLAEALT